jgi:hypothetical protein
MTPMQPKSFSQNYKKRFFKSLLGASLLTVTLASGAFFASPDKAQAADCTIGAITMSPNVIPGDWYTSIEKNTVTFTVQTTNCYSKEVTIKVDAEQRSTVSENITPVKRVFGYKTYVVNEQSGIFSLAFGMNEAGCKSQPGATLDCRYRIEVESEEGNTVMFPAEQTNWATTPWWGHECNDTCNPTNIETLILRSKTGLLEQVSSDCSISYFIINPAKPVAADWYKETDASKKITWISQLSPGCIGKQVDFSIQIPNGSKVFEKKNFVITNTQQNFWLKPDEILCSPNSIPDCQYRFFANPKDGYNDEKQYPVSNDEWWGYNCDGPCTPLSVDAPIKFSDWIDPATGLPLSGGGGITPITPDAITNGQDVADANSPCWDATLNSGAGGYKDGCYELISDLPFLGDLKNRIRAVEFDDEANSFADFINVLFRFAIGAAGVLGVIMIIVEAWKYMTSTSGEMKSLLKGRILNILMGLVLLLGTVVLLQTINPDLLRLEIGIEEIDINIEGDSQSPAISVGPGTNNVSYATIQATGVTCPGSGGKAALPGIINSFIANKSKFTYSQALRGKSCYNGSFCVDCSFTTSTILSCAGITSVKGVNTATIFTNQNTLEKITSLEKNGNVVLVNGKALQVGDVMGWSLADDVTYSKDYQGSGHVVMYMGNGKTIESYGPKGNRKTIATQSADFYWTKRGKALKWVIRLP